MSSLKFILTPTEDKPTRRYRKGSKYDAIIDDFEKQKYTLAKVSVDGKEANYLRTQLNKRIDARKMKNISISVVNNICYIEKK